MSCHNILIQELCSAECCCIWHWESFRPLGKVVSGNNDVSISTVAFWQKSQKVDPNTIERLSNWEWVKRFRSSYRFATSLAGVTGAHKVVDLFAHVGPKISFLYPLVRL